LWVVITYIFISCALLITHVRSTPSHKNTKIPARASFHACGLQMYDLCFTQKRTMVLAQPHAFVKKTYAFNSFFI